MSGSGRKRSSKWDLKEGSRIPFEDVEDNAWPGKVGISFRDKESRRDWLSPEASGGTRSKFSAMEPLPGRRGSRRDDIIDEDHSRMLKATSWDEDENYGTRMSPGLEDWRDQKLPHSPKNGIKRSRRSRSRSWSRSRSPVHGLGRESGAYDRNRSRSTITTQLCKDFVAGRCRRGSHCPFLHQDTETYEDDWERHRKTPASKYSLSQDSKQYSLGPGRSVDCCSEFLKGNCRRGESCRYAHHGASDLSSKGSANEGIRERDNDRRHRSSPERRPDREIRRPTDTACKFFAAGNCRNGNHCRFSHHDQAPVSPDRRSRDGRRPPSQNSDDMEKSWNGPKWSDKRNSDSAKLSEDKNEKLDAPCPRLSAQLMEDGWVHNLVENKMHSKPPTNEVIEIDKKEGLQWKAENAGDNTHVSEQRAAENWLDDMEMSPDWNYKLQPSNHINKGEHASLSSRAIHEGSGRVHGGAAIMPSMSSETSSFQMGYNLKELDGSALPHDGGVAGKISSYMNISPNALAAHSFNKNGLSSNTLPIPNLNAVGQSHEAILTDPSRVGPIINPQNQTLFQEMKVMNNQDIGNSNASLVNSGIPTAKNLGSREQLTQLTNLSASLAQLLANGQQLPQLYATHSSNNGTFATSECPVKPDSTVTIQPNQAVESKMQYDPICDSIEPEKHNVNDNPPDSKLSKNPSPSSLAAVPNAGDFNKFQSQQDPSEKILQLNQQGPGVNSEATKENSKVGTGESMEVQEQDKTAQENGPLENTDGDGKADESKKNKDAKGNRAFKFALVEFVKDLLKPAWKEGQMSKDAYKNIVKKVVDKVTGTIQSANIPSTQEKIEQYLSVSKPKLTKLVQAYVEKFQKDK